MVFCTGLAVAGFVNPALSDDPEESYYSSPAQAAHAAQLADEYAQSYDTVKTAWQAYQDGVNLLGDEPSEEELEAVRVLEAAYKDALVAAVGLSLAEIEDMRNSGMGWGEIAESLDIHPGLLGLGHTKRHRNKYGDADSAEVAAEELAAATSRNTKNGYAKGHSYAASNNGKSSSKSSGIDSAGVLSANTVSSRGRSTDAPGQQDQIQTQTKTKTKEKTNNGSDKGNKGGNSGK